MKLQFLNPTRTVDTQFTGKSFEVTRQDFLANDQFPKNSYQFYYFQFKGIEYQVHFFPNADTTEYCVQKANSSQAKPRYFAQMLITE